MKAMVLAAAAVASAILSLSSATVSRLFGGRLHSSTTGGWQHSTTVTSQGVCRIPVTMVAGITARRLVMAVLRSRAGGAWRPGPP